MMLSLSVATAQNAPIPDSKYSDLKLSLDGGINDYSLPKIVVSQDSKYGLSSEEENIRTTFEYKWDISNIPASEYPLTIIWTKTKEGDFAPFNLASDHSFTFIDEEDNQGGSFVAEFTINNQSDIFSVSFNLHSFTFPTPAPDCFSDFYCSHHPDFPDFLQVKDKDDNMIAKAIQKGLTDPAGAYRTNHNYLETEWLPDFKWFDNFSDYYDFFEQNNFEGMLDKGHGNGAFGVSIMYEPLTGSENNFLFDINHTFENFKIYLGRSASIIIEADVTLENCKVFGYHRMWDKIVVKPGATLTLKDCIIEDGLQGIVVEEGGTLIGHNTIYLSNYRSISVLGGNGPMYSNEADLTDFHDNRFYSIMPNGEEINGEEYTLHSYFWDLMEVPPIECSQPHRYGYSFCGIYVDTAKTEISNKTYFLEDEGANIMSNLANGIVMNRSRVQAAGLIINGMQHNLWEDYEVKGNGIYGTSSYLYLNGSLGSSTNNYPDTYTISDCETGINLYNSYNNILFYTRIKDCLDGINIEHLSGNYVHDPNYQNTLQLKDLILSNKILECKHAINLFPWADVYFNLTRNSSVIDNIIASTKDGASGITSISFSQEMKNNEITLSSNNQEVGDAAIRVINKGAYIPVIDPNPESIPVFQFIDGGSEISENYIEISEVKDGISTSAGRFNKISENTLLMHNNSNESTTRQDMISSRGSRAHIADNTVFGDWPTVPGNAFLQSGIKLENSPNSLVSCNQIKANQALADLLIMGENSGSDIRGNHFKDDREANTNYRQLQYGTYTEPFAVTGRQVHRGNLFAEDEQYAHHYGNPKHSEFIVNAPFGGVGEYVPDHITPLEWFTLDNGGAPTFSCEDSRNPLQDNPYLSWYEEKVGKDHLEDSLFMHRLYLEENTTIGDLSSDAYFELEYGMDLYENDSIINSPAFSSFKSEFLANDYDQLFDLRTGLVFKTENPLLSDPNVTAGDVENYWNSIDTSISGTISAHIASFENTLDDINPGSTEYLLKNEVDIHTVLNAHLDTTESINNYASLLYDIATECPYQGGKSVYFARFLHNKFITPIDFEAMNLCATAKLRFKSKEKNSAEQLLLSPNPVKEHLYLNIANCAYRIYRLDGKLLMHSQTGNGTINVSELGDGIYILRIIGESGESLTAKFIKL